VKDYRDVLIRPVVSEKSYGLLEENVYTFVVAPSASKPEIRDAVEALFDVSVVKVNTLNRQASASATVAPAAGASVPRRSVPSSPSPRVTRSISSRPDHGDS